MSAEGHRTRRVERDGPPVSEAGAAVILIHGRGGSAEGMLGLAREVAPPELPLVAPAADGRSWYPRSFLAPLKENEPWLSSALEWLEALVGELEDEGAPPERLALVGFSQGACLSLEYVSRHPRRYGGVGALSGGLIGPPGRRWDDHGSLDETPVFLGCSDQDPHIPLERVEESAEVLARRGADVTKRIYPGLGHTVNRDETDHVRSMLAALTEAPD